MVQKKSYRVQNCLAITNNTASMEYIVSEKHIPEVNVYTKLPAGHLLNGNKKLPTEHLVNGESKLKQYSAVSEKLSVEPLFNGDVKLPQLSTEPIVYAKPPQQLEAEHVECWRPFLGFIFVGISSLFNIISSSLVKKLTYIDSGQLSMIRNLCGLLGSLPIAIYSYSDILGPKEYRLILAARGLMGATALYLNMLSFRLLPLAEASVILSTTPALVSVVARVALHEPFGIVQGGAILATVLGMLVSIRLPELIRDGHSLGGPDFVTGLCAAFGCVLLISCTFVVLRKMQGMHYSVLLLHMGVFGTVENGLLTGLLSEFSVPRCGWDQLLVVLVGVTGFLSNIFLILAIQAEAVSVVSVVKSSLEIVFATAGQALFFDIAPDAYNLGGALIVMVSVTASGVAKWLTTLPLEHPRRRQLRFLLL